MTWAEGTLKICMVMEYELMIRSERCSSLICTLTRRASKIEQNTPGADLRVSLHLRKSLQMFLEDRPVTRWQVVAARALIIVDHIPHPTSHIQAGSVQLSRSAILHITIIQVGSDCKKKRYEDTISSAEVHVRKSNRISAEVWPCRLLFKTLLPSLMAGHETSQMGRGASVQCYGVAGLGVEIEEKQGI